MMENCYTKPTILLCKNETFLNPSMFQWSKIVLEFCILLSKYDVNVNLIRNVFANINNAVGEDVLLLLSKCSNESNLIKFEPTVSGAVGTTTYDMRANQDIFGANVTIDVRLAQSCGLFTNVLLHEMMHAVGLQHNNDTTSIMYMKVLLSPSMEVIQNVAYLPISRSDVRRLCRNITKCLLFSHIYPEDSSMSHISASHVYMLPVTIKLPRTKYNSKKYFWRKKI